MKKTISLALSIFLMLAVVAGCDAQLETPEQSTQELAEQSSEQTFPDDADGGEELQVVKIGVFEPITGGGGGPAGQPEVLGMQYANYVTPAVEIGGEIYTVELVIADNQSDHDKTRIAAQTLIDADCSVVLGSFDSGMCIAASPTFGVAGMPVIGVTCTNPAVTEGNSHYFRICSLDPFQGTVLANFARDNFSATKAYCLAKQGDDYSEGLCDTFMETFEAAGGECVYETFQEDMADYSSYITSAKAAGAEVFFSPVSPYAAWQITEQAATQDFSIPILGGDTWEFNVVPNVAQGKNVQIYITTFYQEGGAPGFDAGIKEWINSDPQTKSNNGSDDKVAAFTAMGYDAYHVALEALKAAGSTEREAVLQALPGVTYHGVCGSVAFDEQGDAIRDSACMKKVNTEIGEWEFFKWQDVK